VEFWWKPPALVEPKYFPLKKNRTASPHPNSLYWLFYVQAGVVFSALPPALIYIR
jgi:hypothetical protein